MEAFQTQQRVLTCFSSTCANIQISAGSPNVRVNRSIHSHECVVAGDKLLKLFIGFYLFFVVSRQGICYVSTDNLTVPLLFEAVNIVYLRPVCSFCLVLASLEKAISFLKDKMSPGEFWGIDPSFCSFPTWIHRRLELAIVPCYRPASEEASCSDAAIWAQRLGAVSTVFAGSTCHDFSGQNHAQK